MNDELLETQLRQALGVTLRRLRKEAKISQESLAHESGVPRAHMGLLERGKHLPGFLTTYKLLPGLRVTYARFAVEFEKSLRNVRKKKK